MKPFDLLNRATFSLACLLAGLLLIATPALADDPVPSNETAAADESVPAEEPAPADEAADADAEITLADLGLSTETIDRLEGLAAKFNYGTPLDVMASGIVLNLPLIDDESSLESSLDDIDRAIELCGIDTDFASPPEPTGDELFDRYAEAVDDRLTGTKLDYDITLRAAVIPDEVLAAWEPEFGEDPHYWELRYLLADARASGLFDAGTIPESSEGETPQEMSDEAVEPVTTYPRPMDFLLEAERRGCASSNTLLLLYLEARNEHYDALEELTTYEGARSLTTWNTLEEMIPLRPEFSAEVLAEAMKLQAAHENREADLLEAACFRGYNEAWPYYFRGFNRLSLGEFEAGLRDLKKGNSAPVNRYPVPYPVAEIEESMLAGEPLGGPVVCGAVQLMLISYVMPNFIKMKDDCRGAMLAAELGGNIEAYDAWHHFACRLPESRETVFIQAMVSTVLVRMLREGMVDNHAAELSPGQLEALWRFNTALDVTKERLKHRGRRYDDLGNALTLGFAGGPRGIALNQYLLTAIDLHIVHDEALPVIHDMAEFSYLDMRTPAAMEKYAAVPDDLFHDHIACRRAGWIVTDFFGQVAATFNQPELATDRPQRD